LALQASGAKLEAAGKSFPPEPLGDKDCSLKSGFTHMGEEKVRRPLRGGGEERLAGG
jgi:hypothetical protein